MSFRSSTILLTFIAVPAAAQVGYPPARSPFLDLEYKQEMSGFVGVFRPGLDPAKVAPRGGPVIGARYEVRIGGPAQFVARAARVWSERTPVVPSEPAATRYRPKQDWNLYLFDAGLSVNLTGQKSFHRLVPVVAGGIGIVSDGQTEPDEGGFRFGTTFAFSFGTGVRYTPTGRLQFRADLNDWLYQVKYPLSYTQTTSDNTSVISGRRGTSVWKHNAMLTIGASYVFWR